MIVLYARMNKPMGSEKSEDGLLKIDMGDVCGQNFDGYCTYSGIFI